MKKLFILFSIFILFFSQIYADDYYTSKYRLVVPEFDSLNWGEKFSADIISIDSILQIISEGTASVLSDEIRILSDEVNIISEQVTFMTMEVNIISNDIAAMKPGNTVQAWVRFDGTSGATVILDNYNVISVHRVQTGIYGISWDQDFANVSYCVVASSNAAGERTQELNTYGCKITTVNSGGSATDSTIISVIAIGDR